MKDFGLGERRQLEILGAIFAHDVPRFTSLMTHKYRGSQQSSREVKPKFIDSTQGEPKDIYKP
jgi:hypothetical protein